MKAEQNAKPYPAGLNITHNIRNQNTHINWPKYQSSILMFERASISKGFGWEFYLCMFIVEGREVGQSLNHLHRKPENLSCRTEGLPVSCNPGVEAVACT